ncbi:FAD-dependent oxidoreductase [Rhodococcus sp. HNM0569]|uniref:FAD-dependent oxidoreductase n=1 Tax=Rhodococcus sp. HNM0569 TaxID=2716340 RepID=UPI001469B145|nr:FAD-dependent oxidoreductase [Rhodococcus sp. HNM0569]NLU83741.1 FAD-dependent oxidoreductase [Rhodococcus sp. HNM0569]
MVYVITQPCCNDASCVDVCPVNCIHPSPDEPEFATAEMLYIDPATCIDCGACVDECPVSAIKADNELDEGEDVYLTAAEEFYDRHPIGPDWPEPPTTAKIPADLGTLHVAIVGSGPSACYAAMELASKPRVEVDVFDRLPTPYGLVRAGVAPDHPGTKGVTDQFRSALRRKNVACHFGVEVGRDVSHDELLAHHHAVVYAVGASSDRQLGVPGEELSVAATEFVAWYNGHPDYADRTFDLSGERAVVVGNGNVALDVARILLAEPDELARTDIADHAVEALRASNIREVVILGRRGPAHAAFTTPEMIALSRMVDIVVDPAEAELDPVSADELEKAEPWIRRKVSMIQGFAENQVDPSRKRIVLRFLASPTEILGTDAVAGVRVGRNRLVAGDGQALVAEPTGESDTLDAGLVLRSVGYRGVAVPGVPFDERRGVLPNEHGRVVDPDSGEPVRGVYAAGWIKRGPSGVIGTNKFCSAETVSMLIDDFVAGRLDSPGDREGWPTLLSERAPEALDFAAWERIDAAERSAGADTGRPRRKLVSIAEMLASTRS